MIICQKAKMAIPAARERKGRRVKSLRVYDTPPDTRSGGAWQEVRLGEPPATDGVITDEPIAFYGKNIAVASDKGRDILSVRGDECEVRVYQAKGEVVVFGTHTEVNSDPKTLHVSSGETCVDVNTDETVVLGGVVLTVKDKQKDVSILALSGDLHIVPGRGMEMNACGIRVDHRDSVVTVSGKEPSMEMSESNKLISLSGGDFLLKYGDQIEVSVLNAKVYIGDDEIRFHGNNAKFKIGKQPVFFSRVKDGLLSYSSGTIYCNGKELGKFKLPKP